MTKKTAVIAGASGLIGRRIAEQLLTDPQWAVTGLARRAQTRPGMQWIAVDLADRADVEKKLAGISATHIFYAAHGVDRLLGELQHTVGRLRDRMHESRAAID